MTTWIALLRGVNLAGRRPVAMADLRALATTLGFRDVRSLLQSGNLVFRAKAASGASIERLLEREAPTRLGLAIEFFVRSEDEWASMIEANPFPKEAVRDPGHLLLAALKDAPSAEKLGALRAAIKGRERVDLRGNHAFLVYPDGVGRSKLTSAIIDRTLGTRGTGRNWNTVLKLAAAAREVGG